MALTLTGLSRQAAKFEARSAWTGPGFTTAESEIDTRDYAGLMHLAGEYAIAELFVKEDDRLASKPLAELRLPEEGVVVPGIEHPDGTDIGAPRGSSVAVPGAIVVIYGRSHGLSALERRRADLWRRDRSAPRRGRAAAGSGKGRRGRGHALSGNDARAQMAPMVY